MASVRRGSTSRGHHRRPARHRLQDRQPEAFREGGVGETRRAAVERREVVVRDAVETVEVPVEMGVPDRAHGGLRRADQHEGGVASHPAATRGEGVEEAREVLPGDDGAHEQDVRRADAVAREHRRALGGGDRPEAWRRGLGDHGEARGRDPVDARDVGPGGVRGHDDRIGATGRDHAEQPEVDALDRAVLGRHGQHDGVVHGHHPRAGRAEGAQAAGRVVHGDAVSPDGARDVELEPARQAHRGEEPERAGTFRAEAVPPGNDLE
jgi:hypothetical protein